MLVTPSHCSAFSHSSLTFSRAPETQHRCGALLGWGTSVCAFLISRVLNGLLLCFMCCVHFWNWTRGIMVNIDSGECQTSSSLYNHPHLLPPEIWDKHFETIWFFFLLIWQGGAGRSPATPPLAPTNSSSPPPATPPRNCGIFQLVGARKLSRNLGARI